MTREDAYKFIRLYKQFQATGLRITDYDKDRTEIQLEWKGEKVWNDDWYAAKCIEANSN